MGTGKGSDMSEYLQSLIPGLRTTPIRVTNVIRLKQVVTLYLAFERFNDLPKPF